MNLKKLKNWLRRTSKSARPKDAAAPPPSPAVAEGPRSRQGIPILNPDEDLAGHFRDTPVTEESRAAHATVSARTTASCEARPKAPPAPSVPRSPARRGRRNRAGIRQLGHDVDLYAAFQDTASDAEASPDPRPQTPPAPQRPPASTPDVSTDRHGIPRLDDRVDLHQLFEATSDDARPDGDLEEALRQSLAHDARELMKRKSGGFFPPRRLSLKEKLRRYPPPQAQLDLHGETALSARLRAEAFIQTARADGLFTLRVIVGKGLHSTDGAVLPDVIEDLAVTLKRQGVVLTYRWDKKTKRKSGAMIVYLATAFH